MKAEKEFFVFLSNKGGCIFWVSAETQVCMLCTYSETVLSCQVQCILIHVEYRLNVSTFIYSLINSTFNSGQTHLPALHISTARFCKHTPPPTAYFFSTPLCIHYIVTPRRFVGLTKEGSWVDRLGTHRTNEGKQREGTRGCWVNNATMRRLRFCHDNQLLFFVFLKNEPKTQNKIQQKGPFLNFLTKFVDQYVLADFGPMNQMEIQWRSSPAPSKKGTNFSF